MNFLRSSSLKQALKIFEKKRHSALTQINDLNMKVNFYDKEINKIAHIVNKQNKQNKQNKKTKNPYLHRL